MRSPSNAEGPVIEYTMSGPLTELLPGGLEPNSTLNLAARQADFVARRYGIRADRARLVAGLVFGGTQQ